MARIKNFRHVQLGFYLAWHRDATPAVTTAKIAPATASPYLWSIAQVENFGKQKDLRLIHIDRRSGIKPIVS
ncbi:MAG: hypothetical protein AB1801_13975 [Chloroflexota bacterium]